MTTLSYERNGKSYSAEVETMKPDTIAYLLQYGWRQSLQDSIAGLEKKALENGDDPLQAIDGQLMKRSDAILSGSITMRSAGESRDPLRTVANDMVARALVKKGTTRSKVGKEKFDVLVDQLLANNRAKVEAEMQRRKDLEVEVELD